MAFTVQSVPFDFQYNGVVDDIYKTLYMSNIPNVDITRNYDYDLEYMLSYARLLFCSNIEFDVIVSVYGNETDLYNSPIPPLSIDTEYKAIEYLKDKAEALLNDLPDYNNLYDYKWRQYAIDKTYDQKDTYDMIYDMWSQIYSMKYNYSLLEQISYSMNDEVLQKYFRSVLLSLY